MTRGIAKSCSGQSWPPGEDARPRQCVLFFFFGTYCPNLVQGGPTGSLTDLKGKATEKIMSSRVATGDDEWRLEPLAEMLAAIARKQPYLKGENKVSGIIIM